MHVCIVGATGAVGQEIVSLLESGPIEVDGLRLFASGRKPGAALAFQGKDLPVRTLGASCFEGADLVFFSAGATVSQQWVPAAVRAGARVIDNSSAFRMEPHVPLVVPEVNKGVLDAAHRIIANPNCSAALLVLPLKAIHDLSPLERVLVATYQAASGVGVQGMKELEAGIRAALEGREAGAQVFPQPLAFNVVPQVGDLEAGGFTAEEWKIARETRKIMDLPDLKISATCVRVPVVRAHSEAVYVETREALDPARVAAALDAFPGVRYIQDPVPTPLAATGRWSVRVGRCRQDPDVAQGLHFWLTGDQLLKGAALNAVQVAVEVVSLPPGP